MQKNPENAEECKRMQKNAKGAGMFFLPFYLFTFLPLKC